jgi:hypothetical protein
VFSDFGEEGSCFFNYSLNEEGEVVLYHVSEDGKFLTRAGSVGSTKDVEPEVRLEKARELIEEDIKRSEGTVVEIIRSGVETASEPVEELTPEPAAPVEPGEGEKPTSPPAATPEAVEAEVVEEGLDEYMENLEGFYPDGNEELLIDCIDDVGIELGDELKMKISKTDNTRGDLEGFWAGDGDELWESFELDEQQAREFGDLVTARIEVLRDFNKEMSRLVPESESEILPIGYDYRILESKYIPQDLEDIEVHLSDSDYSTVLDDLASLEFDIRRRLAVFDVLRKRGMSTEPPVKESEAILAPAPELE